MRNAPRVSGPQWSLKGTVVPQSPLLQALWSGAPSGKDRPPRIAGGRGVSFPQPVDTVGLVKAETTI